MIIVINNNYYHYSALQSAAVIIIINLVISKMERNKSTSANNYSKLIAMGAFLCMDLALNGTLDYDLFNNQNTSKNASNILLGLLGLQIVIQIAIFLILFIALADTFLFRVGLLGLLVRKFKMVLLIHPVYIFITALTGSFRVRHFGNAENLYGLWQNNTFVQLSTAQKISKCEILEMFALVATFVFAKFFFHF